MARSFVSASSQYLEYAGAIVTAQPLTMACWFKAASLGNFVEFMSIGGTTTDLSDWYLGATFLDKIEGVAGASNGVQGNPTTSTAFGTGTWNHACAVFTSSTSRASYLNGAGKGTNTSAVTVTATNLSRTDIGARMQGGIRGRFFDGQLAEVCIWNVALTDAEVLALASRISPRRIRAGSLVGYWPLWGLQSPEPDLSGSGHSMVITGATFANHAPVALWTPRWITPSEVIAPPSPPPPPPPPPTPVVVPRTKYTFAKTYTAWSTKTFPKVYQDLSTQKYPTTYKSWTNWMQITLKKLDASPGGNTLSQTTVTTAYRGIPSQSELRPTGGTYQGAEWIFRLPIDLLGTIVPLPGDVIVDDVGASHAIEWAHLAQLTQEYRCKTIALSIYLPDSITIERPIYIQDATGLDVPTYSPIYTISCRVQPVSVNAVVEAGQAQQTRTFDVIIAQQLNLFPTDRILWNGDYYFDITLVDSKGITDFPTLRMRSSN